MSTCKTTDLKASTELFQLVSDFKRAETIEISTITSLIKNICDIFCIDRAFTARRLDVHRAIIVPVMEYTQGEVIITPTPDVSTISNTNTVQETDSYAKRFEEIALEQQLFSKEDLVKYDAVLQNVNYKKSEDHITNELIVNCINTQQIFAYVTLERFEGNDPFSKEEFFFIQTIFEVLTSKIADVISAATSSNEKKIKEAIVTYEEMPVCLVEKNTHSIIYFNEFFQAILPNAELGMSYTELCDQIPVSEIATPELLCLANPTTGSKEYWIKKSVPLTLHNDTDVYLIYTKNTHDYIQQLEGIDLLTSAFSPKGFIEYFDLTLRNAYKKYYLCTLDIDKFKYLNYSLGFSIGNQILKNIANIIDQVLVLPEIYCRLNGDRFAMILQCDSRDDVTKRLQELFNKIDEMQIEFLSEVKMKFTCGVKKIEPQYSINQLLDYANSTRKTAKGYHENTVTFFDKTVAERERAELNLEQRISQAVEDDEFALFLQPKFELKTNRIYAAEALVRWFSKEGIIFPDKFIPLFEKDGFINTLDFIMYKKVMQHIRKCLDAGFDVYPISLNVSRSHIQNKNFINQFADLVHEYNVPVELLELEVTESMFVEDRTTLIEFIENIKKLGITVSIDDFGTAYSSLQVLKDVEIDTLKIDKGFLDTIGFASHDQATKDAIVLKNIIHLATELGYKVICEGIETKEQVEFLIAIGCDYGQGYVFAKPMPIHEYEQKYLHTQKELESTTS